MPDPGFRMCVCYYLARPPSAGRPLVPGAPPPATRSGPDPPLCVNRQAAPALEHGPRVGWDITGPRRRGLPLFPAASGGLRGVEACCSRQNLWLQPDIGTARHDPRLPRGLGRWALRLGSASPFRSRLPGFAPSQRRTRLALLLVLPLSDITVAGFTPILAAQLPHACSRLCHQVHGPVGRTCHHEVAACVS